MAPFVVSRRDEALLLRPCSEQRARFQPLSHAARATAFKWHGLPARAHVASPTAVSLPTSPAVVRRLPTRTPSVPACARP